MSRARQNISVCCRWVCALGLFLFTALNLVAQSTQSVTLAWNASPDPGVVGYILRYGTNSGAYPNSLNVGSQTSATLTGLQSGRTYYMVVVAFNAAGLESVPSNEVGYQVPGGTNNSTTTPPSSTGGSPSSPWQTVNIGNVGVAGNLGIANGIVSIQGAGSLGGLADNCFFAYQTLSGDGEIRVRLNTKGTLTGAGGVGLMVRESLAPGSTSVFLGPAANGYLLWQYRVQTAGSAVSVYAGPSAWFRLVRTGNVFIGYTSADGKTWSMVVFCTAVMAPSVNIGFAVASGNASSLTSVAFDNVTVNGVTAAATPPPTTPAPTITLTAPTAGMSALAPATFNLTAGVTANGHAVSAVQFYNGTTLLGQTTTAPYTLAWNNVTAGNYSLSARLLYDTSLTVTSAPVSVTVTNPLAAPTIVLTAPVTGTAALAPAAFNLAANVTANGHVVSAVQFYNGSTLLGQVATAPYTLAWNNVAAGTYPVSAKLIYDSTSTLTSATATVSVTNAPPPANNSPATNSPTLPPNTNSTNTVSLPLPWQTFNLGNVGVAGNASASNGAITVQGAGSLGGLADNCFFAYQTLSGDGEIRVRLNAKGALTGAGAVGIMVRESLTPGSTSVFLGPAANGYLLWQYRVATATSAAAVYAGPSTWLRLVRTGNVFVGYTSADGKTWGMTVFCTAVMAPNVNIGIASASGSTNTLTSVTFDNIAVTP